MKKLMCILLTLTMLLSLGACGQESTQQEMSAVAAESAASETVEAPSETPAPVSNQEEAATPEMTSAEEDIESSLEETASNWEAPDLSGQTLMIYCGAGMQEPFQEIATAFQDATGCEMNVTYANAAQIQTQITESQEGDFFIAGSGDEVKPVADYVENSVDLVKHIPVLAVAEGNPKGITGIADLANADIATVIGDAESTPIGKIAVKAFSDFGISDQVNLVATTTTAPQLATVISVGEADAAIIWKENCNVDGVEICETTDMDAYVKTIPAARLTFVVNTAAADAFSSFLDSEAAWDIWTAYGYELVG